MLTIRACDVILGVDVKKTKDFEIMNKKSSKVPESVRKKAYAQYVNYNNYNVFNHMGCSHVAVFTIWLWTVFMGLVTPSFPSWAEEYGMTLDKKLAQRARDTFWPVSNDWHVAFNKNNGQFKYDYYGFSGSMRGKFRPRAVWYVNMACLLLAACWGVGVAKNGTRARRTDRAQEETVDMMLNLPFVGANNARKVKKLMRVAPDIVSNMSRDRRIYFDMLLNPDKYENTDIKAEIINNDSIRDLAVEIMAGHLQSHPSDMDMAICACAQNAIPRSMLMAKLNQKQR